MADDLLEPPLETPAPEVPPIDDAAQAQEAREIAALRTARSGTRGRTPVAMTPQFPARVTNNDEYEALQPGSTFIAPDGNQRVKPWYVTDDTSYDRVPEGAEFVDPQGQRRQKPRYGDLPFQVQTLYNMAVNDRERYRILERSYPGQVRTSASGELYVDDNGTRRKAKTFSTAANTGTAWGGVAAQAAPVIGSVIGDIVGGAVGAFGGPPGVVAGAVTGGGAGAAGGQYFNDMMLQLAGVYDRTSEEAATQYLTEGLLGAGGSLVGRGIAAVGPGVREYARKMVPGQLARFLGAGKESVDTAVGLAERGVLVPPSAVFKEAPHLHNIAEVLDPAFRTQRVLEQSATGHMEGGAGQILRDLGIQEPGAVVKPAAAVQTEAAGARIKAKAMEEVAASDAALADRLAQARAQAMAEDVLGTMNRPQQQELAHLAEQNRQAAQRLIDNGFQEIQHSVDQAMTAAGADVNSGMLWQQVAERLRALRQAVVQRHRQWYRQADQVAGDLRPNIGTLPATAEQYLARLPEGFENRYPSIVRQLRDLAGERGPNGEWVREPVQPTFGQLHQLRSELRNDVNWFELNRSTDDGTNIFFNNQLNAILHDPNAPQQLQIAAQMLDATDRSYGRNIAAFNDRQLRAVVKGIEAGLPADPTLLFDTLVKSGRSDLTRWVADRVGPTLWAGVRAADTQEMLNASRTLVEGTYDGAAFAREVLKRHRDGMLEAVHGPNAGRLIRQAQDIQALNGTIDVPVRPGDTMSEIIARSRQAAEAARVEAARSPLDTLEQETRRITREHRAQIGAARQGDPLSFLYRPSVGATEAVNKILSKEDNIIEAARRFGENSEEFGMLRQIYAQRVLRETMQPSERLAKISPEVQQLMFTGVTGEQMRQLAREMDFLMGTKAARSGAGRSIMATERVENPWAAVPFGIGKAAGKFIPGVDAMGRAMLASYYKLVTDVVTSPALLRYIQKGLEGDAAERYTIRNLVQNMIYSPSSRRGGMIGAGVGAAQGNVPSQTNAFDPSTIGAKQAPDGQWYLPNPGGGYLRIEAQ